MTAPLAAQHDAYAVTYDSDVAAYGCYMAETLFGLTYDLVEPAWRVLDVGIGTGLSAALFARAGLVVYGMDFAPVMLDICRAKGIAADLRQHDLTQTPWTYEDAAFDVAVCCGVLHFVADVEPAFVETARILRPGGVFAFTTKAPVATFAAGQAREMGNSSELDVFAHAPVYVVDLITRSGFWQRRALRSFVGDDIFWTWVVERSA